jgi:hypothetical protein
MHTAVAASRTSTYAHAHIMNASTQPCTRARAHARTCAYHARALMRSYTHTCTHERARAHTRTHARTLSHPHARTHTHTHALNHMLIRAHARARARCRWTCQILPSAPSTGRWSTRRHEHALAVRPLGLSQIRLRWRLPSTLRPYPLISFPGLNLETRINSCKGTPGSPPGRVQLDQNKSLHLSSGQGRALWPRPQEASLPTKNLFPVQWCSVLDILVTDPAGCCGHGPLPPPLALHDPLSAHGFRSEISKPSP